MSGDPRCENLRQSHAKFHGCAADIIRAKLANRKTDALKALNGDFVRYSDETVKHIDVIRHAWAARGGAAKRAVAPAVVRAAIPAKLVGEDDQWEEF
jgi:hypothetical protein